MTLRVSPEQVRNSANQIESQKRMMDQLMQSMSQAVTALPQEAWASVSGTNFAQQYQAVQRECQGALNNLITNIANLRKAADEYDRIEQSQKQKIGNLNTGNIFPS